MFRTGIERRKLLMARLSPHSSFVDVFQASCSQRDHTLFTLVGTKEIKRVSARCKRYKTLKYRLIGSLQLGTNEKRAFNLLQLVAVPAELSPEI